MDPIPGFNSFPSLELDCCVILNHNLEGMRFLVADAMGQNYFLPSGYNNGDDELINWNDGLEYNGFTIAVKNTPFITPSQLVDNPMQIIDFAVWSGEGVEGNVGDRYIGSWFVGKTWSPPHDPKVTMKRIFDGVKSSKTKGGFSQHHIDYLGNPLWSGHNAWEFWKYPESPSEKWPKEDPSNWEQNMFTEDNKKNLGRLGRRSWSLSFDLISESDVFAALEQTNWESFLETDTYPSGTETFSALNYDNPILREDNFISRVWIPTLGGSIPFVFQIDKTNNLNDQFAICVFDKHSLNITPKAPNVYNISCTILEVW